MLPADGDVVNQSEEKRWPPGRLEPRRPYRGNGGNPENLRGTPRSSLTEVYQLGWLYHAAWIVNAA